MWALMAIPIWGLTLSSSPSDPACPVDPLNGASVGQNKNKVETEMKQWVKLRFICEGMLESHPLLLRLQKTFFSPM